MSYVFIFQRLSVSEFLNLLFCTEGHETLMPDSSSQRMYSDDANIEVPHRILGLVVVCCVMGFITYYKGMND